MNLSRWIVVCVGAALLAGCATDGSHDLLGKQAPGASLDLVGGGTLDLADHLGKDVVLLDFWATWCPPCREALPVVSGVAAEYEADGLIFCAVNIGETAEEVKAHLAQAGLDIPVGLDADGSVSDRFGVTGIPQTVVIGKDGTVQVVHVGYSSSMGGQLKAEIGKLLAGEQLVTPAAS